ncbi:mucosa-associated lymphoid tissue lymphoma translocation protein 1-like [Saccoglossus kowalevskii]|uniref:Mucosa-associated lymphoid tissue lymphoma translocation protein 1-like n=1 Tax=Saccoglossus kowalevskii TaxID=10224 RepID=A0ABM0MBZ0_SACKO|nr:PREDICTED: mucosa-associated lymphoid tissue lymphoma translocation protein 1-like [Saccoglossus kowalevskii]
MSGVSVHLNICDIPYNIQLKLQTFLDVLDTNKNWRGLIAAIPDNPYSAQEIDMFGLDILRFGSSPTASLLRDLGNKGRTVKQLISYLEVLKHEPALMLLKKEEPISIISQPQAVNIQNGGTLELSCNAMGFPYPKYVWFRTVDKEINGNRIRQSIEVENGCDRVLRIEQITTDYNGMYICRIHNRISYQFTNWVHVKVIAKTDPPVIIEQPRSQCIEIGRPLKLTCEAIGRPAPKYQWFRNEQHMVEQTSSEIYYDVSASQDAAKYRCKVYNNSGEVWSDTVQITIIQAGPPVIRRQPDSVRCPLGHDVSFHCEVTGIEPISYQWYDAKSLIRGAIKSELCINKVKYQHRGWYQCHIRNGYGDVITEKATLEIESRPPLPPPQQLTQYFATDKVALVIGNQDYRCEQQLKAPVKDAYTITEILTTECNYKVVSLIDLTLSEMEAAVSAFSELLDSGVYGLFYFAGHGFETQGQSYLLPVDAPSYYTTEDCLCAQYILDKMQQRNTGLNVLLLDICRKENVCNGAKPENVIPYKPRVCGNTVFGYASSPNTQAFELKDASNGIFMKYLKLHLASRLKVNTMLDKVIEAIKDDKDVREKQYPEVKSDLRDHRTLRDEIISDGHTQEFNIRRMRWEEAHLMPMNPLLVAFDLQTFQVKVKIHFTAEFSNVMLIYVQVVDPGKATRCIATLHNFPKELDVNIKYANRSYNDTIADCTYPRLQLPVKDKSLITRIKNIQKLTSDLELTVILDMVYEGQKIQSTCPALKIPQPGISKSKIFQRRPVEQSCPLK